MTTTDTPARPTPPALFLLLDLPFGAAVGYLMIAVPFWLSEAGVSLADIAALSATAFMPHALKLLWIPVLDIGSHKRTWYLAMTAATAGLLVAASLVPDPVHHLGVYAALVTLAQATATTGHAANNALMAITTRPEDKGKAAGFSMASNVGGTNLLGAGALLVSRLASRPVAGLVLAGIVVASGAASLRIHEPRLAWGGGRRNPLAAVGVHLWEMVKDLWRAVRSREGFTGIVISLAPVGCGALTNLFAAMAKDYAASSDVVETVNGIGSGAVSALGALVGGYLADRMSRRLAYAMAGGVTALSAIAMLLSPMTPATYAWGVLAYSFANGIAFATWAGMVLELVGLSAATTTKYGLFNATSNLAISYTTAVDGWYAAYAGGAIGWGFLRFSLPHWPALVGSRAALLMDAALTFCGIAILLAMVAVVRRRDARQRRTSPSPQEGARASGP